jgi:signal transduction histidine kinase
VSNPRKAEPLQHGERLTIITQAGAAPDPEKFPFIAVVDALTAWQADPGDEARDQVRRALAGAMTIAGATGAYVDLRAEPLEPIAVGEGTLRRRPGRATRAREFRLVEETLQLELGTLWLDQPVRDEIRVARALGRAVLAVWSMAEAHETNRSLEALDNASRAVAGVLTVDRVLQTIVDSVRTLVGARYAALGTTDQEGQIDRFITSGIAHAERERIGTPPRGRGLLGLLIEEGRTLRVDDIALHPARAGFPPHHPPMRTLLGVPLVVKGRVVGDLYLTEKRGGGPFTGRDERLVELFANHAAIAIDNARLHEQVSRLAVVEERERIGKDLHDGIIQAIYAVGLSLEDVPDLMASEPDEAAARVERAIEHLNLAIRDIRNFIFGLRPELLERAGLQAGLAALADEFRLNTMIDVEVLLEGREAEALADDDTLQLLHIAREALSNVARHSRATRARIELEARDGEAVLTIADNGQGFAVDGHRGPGHQGLSNMRGRAVGLGGRFEVESAPQDGTRIIVRVPLRPAGDWGSADEAGWPTDASDRGPETIREDART